MLGFVFSFFHDLGSFTTDIVIFFRNGLTEFIEFVSYGIFQIISFLRDFFPGF